MSPVYPLREAVVDATASVHSSFVVVDDESSSSLLLLVVVIIMNSYTSCPQSRWSLVDISSEKWFPLADASSASM